MIAREGKENSMSHSSGIFVSHILHAMYDILFTSAHAFVCHLLRLGDLTHLFPSLFLIPKYGKGQWRPSNMG